VDERRWQPRRPRGAPSLVTGLCRFIATLLGATQILGGRT